MLKVFLKLKQFRHGNKDFTTWSDLFKFDAFLRGPAPNGEPVDSYGVGEFLNGKKLFRDVPSLRFLIAG